MGDALAIPAVDQEGVAVRSRSSQVTLSVVIPCYNLGEFLMDAVASVEALVDDRVEVVIVDDGSDDQASPAVFRYLEDQGYEVIHQANAGVAAARNAGIAAARGRYLLPLDADNCILPQYITRAMERLDEDDRTGVVYGDAVYFGDREGRWTVGEFSLDRLVRGNFIDACAVFRRDVWDSCGGYDPKMPAQGWEDWDFWLGAAERGWGFHYIPEVLFRYRVRRDSMLARTNRPDNLRRLTHYVASKHARLYAARFPEIWGEATAERAEFQQQLSARDEEIRSLGNAAAELGALRAALAARNEDVRSATASLAELGKEVASRDIRIIELEWEARNAESEARRNAESEARNATQQREQLTAERDELSRELGVLAANLEKARTRTRELDAELATLTAEASRLRQLEKRVQEMQEAYGLSQRAIEQLRHDQNQHAAAQTAVLSEAHAEINRLRLALVARDAEIHADETLILAVLSSKSWRLTAPLRFLRTVVLTVRVRFTRPVGLLRGLATRLRG